MENNIIPEHIKFDSEHKNENCDLERLSTMLNQMTQLEEQVKKCKEKLKEAEAQFNFFSQEEIPNYLFKFGLSEVKLKDGRKVSVSTDVSVTIKDKNKFHNFLESRNETDIEKIEVKFPAKMEADKKAELFDFLSSYECNLDQGVHSQTLKKYFRELLGTKLQPEEKTEKIQSGEVLTTQDISEFSNVFEINKTKIKK